MSEELANRDRRIALIAARQHGVVSVQQLTAAGIGKDSIHKRVRLGRFHRIHRGSMRLGIRD